MIPLFYKKKFFPRETFFFYWVFFLVGDFLIGGLYDLRLGNGKKIFFYKGTWEFIAQ